MSKSKHGLMHWLTCYEKISSKKGMAGWLIKKGIAKNTGMANVELIIVSLFFFALSKLSFIIINL